jgi:hypothetical protein
MRHCNLKQVWNTDSCVAKLQRSEAGSAAAASRLTRLLRRRLLLLLPLLCPLLLEPCTLLLLPLLRGILQAGRPAAAADNVLRPLLLLLLVLSWLLLLVVVLLWLQLLLLLRLACCQVCSQQGRQSGMASCLRFLQWQCPVDEVLYVLDAWLPEQQPHHLRVSAPVAAVQIITSAAPHQQ